MCRKLIVLVVIASFLSCHHARYTTSTGANGALDFTEGRWVLNDATCVNCDGVRLENKLMEFLKECIKDSIVNLHQERQHKLIMSKISFEPSKTELREISKGTDASYLITLEGKIVKNEFGGMGYQRDGPYVDDENIAEVSIAFYDLKTQTQIHYINTRGAVSVSKDEDDDDGDFVFAPSAYNILSKAIRKDIKKIKKNCKCK